MVGENKYNPELQAYVRQGHHLPGSGDDRDRVRFVSLGISLPQKETYEKVLDQVSPPLASHGGVVLGPVTITTPYGVAFFPLTCNGDVSGWIKQIEIGAGILGCLTAQLDGGRLLVSNGEVFAISSCKVEFG